MRAYDAAAALFRACRLRGEILRRLIDCLIAAVASRAGAEVLHADADFDAPRDTRI
jgi:predicted nucleic acid-binding protein